MFRPEQSQIQGKVCLYKTPEALWDFARQESIQQKVGLIIHGRLNISFCVTADLSRIEICFYIPYFAFQKQIFISKTIRSTGYEIEGLGPLSLFQLIILFSKINKPIPWQVFKFLKVMFEKQQSFILSDFFLLCCQPDTGLSYIQSGHHIKTISPAIVTTNHHSSYACMRPLEIASLSEAKNLLANAFRDISHSEGILADQLTVPFLTFNTKFEYKDKRRVSTIMN